MKRKEKENYQDKIDQFRSASNLKDIAALLNYKAKDLSYILYHLNGGREKQYCSFEISKRNGGKRKISAPTSALKDVQRRINKLLQIIYWEKPSVHSFLKGRTIVSNAECHIHKRFVFNVDLENFFPSINFGRVRGLFIAAPYGIDPKAATVLAQIACYKNELPQGSPCSPIISNMICSLMDSQLQSLAKRERCTYTRYADDITFSTNLPIFPKCIAEIDDRIVSVSDEFCKIIESNGFNINYTKVRLQTRDMRQEVTGLVVNDFTNVRRKLIRQVRAMLHSWEKYGLEKAEEEHNTKYRLNPTASKEGDDGENDKEKNKNFREVIEGKISFITMVRSEKMKKTGKSKYKKKGQTPADHISLNLINKLYEQILREGDLPIVRTEGASDWMHLSTAWQQISQDEKYKDLKFDFFSVKKDICFGSERLLKFINIAKDSKKPFPKKVICIFDRDIDKINNIHKGKDFKSWGNNRYSFILPSPKRYQDKEISIEFLYPKEFLRTKDEKGRRLFFSDEFKKDGTHTKLKNVKFGYNPNTNTNYKGWSKILERKTKVIDFGVYKKKGEKYYSIALSKTKFAYNILKKEKGFKNPNFRNFKKVFDVIGLIVRN